MLKDRISQDLTKRIEEQQTLQKKDNVKVELYNEELNYSIIHQLIPEDVQKKSLLLKRTLIYGFQMPT